MSEPFSWMDEGQGTEGGRRTDGGKKEGREGKRHSSWAQLLAALPGTHAHTHVNTHHQAHSARLTDACRTVAKTPTRP